MPLNRLSVVRLTAGLSEQILIRAGGEHDQGAGL